MKLFVAGLRVHGRLRHRPDGVDRRALLRAARPRTTPRTAVEQLRSPQGGPPRQAARGPRRRRRAARVRVTSASPDTRSTRGRGRNRGRRGRADAAAEGRGDPPAVPEHRRAGAGLDQDLPQVRRLPVDPQGLQGDDPRGGPQGARGLRPSGPRRSRLLDGQEGLVPAPRRHGQVPLLQRRRVRAGGLQGPRADAEEPAPADRGAHHRRPRRRARTAASSTSAASTTCRATSSSGRSRRPTRQACSARTCWTQASRWSSSSTAAPAPTSAARRRLSSTRSRASAATRG